MESNLTDYISDNDDLPEGWVKTILSAFAVSRKGKKPAMLSESASGNSVPYIDIEAFELGNIRRYADVASSVLVKSGDLLVVWDGARCGLVGRSPDHGALGSTLMQIEPHSVSPAYLFYFLQSCFEEINSNPRGSGITHVAPEKFWNLEVPLAPFAEQLRIVQAIKDLLPHVYYAKQHLEKASQMVERFRQAVLSAACSGTLTEDWRFHNHPPDSGPLEIRAGNFDIPEGWYWHEAGEYYQDACYGTSAKCTYSNRDIPVLRIPNIATGQISVSNVKYAQLSEAEMSKLCLQAGDILICRTNGSLDLIGKAAVMPLLETRYAFASYLIRVRLNSNLIDPDYYHIFITSSVARNQIEERARSTAGQYNINLPILRELEIPVPPLPEQRIIVERVRSLLAVADVIENKIEVATLHTDNVTQSILAKAFRGELILTEAELARQEGRSYEPASELLEKIKNQLKTMAKVRKGRN